MGYEADFLGSSVPSVPLPTFSKALASDVLERDTLSADDASGRRIYRHYHNYTVVMSQRHRTALFAALNVDQSHLQTTDRTAGWRIDDAVGAEYQLHGDYYYENAWDKGHLAPDAAAGWGSSEEERVQATNDTYYYTNATLQHENFNRDEWKDLETTIRAWQKDATNRLSEITGPIFGMEGKGEVVHPDGHEPATVPAGFFKVVAYVGTTAGGEHHLQVRCFVIYQDAKHLEGRGGVIDHKSYQVSVSDVEKLTGLVFAPVYHTANLGYNTPPPQSDGSAAVCIAAAMVDPAGKDTGAEWISICNRSDTTISLEGWKLQDQKGRTLILSSVELDSGGTCTIQPISPVRLVNSGGELTLLDQGNHVVDTVTYTKQQVKEGVAVEFYA